LKNVTGGTYADLLNGAATGDVGGWGQGNTFQNQYWHITLVTGTEKTKDNTYYIVNIGTDTYLAVKDGSKEDGAAIQCEAKDTASLGKIQWYITAKDTHWKFQNVAASADDSTAGYLHLPDGSTTNGTKLQGHKNVDDGSQWWDVSRKTRSASEIITIAKKETVLKDVKNIVPKYYYLQMPHAQYTSIWYWLSLSKPGRTIDATAIALKNAVNLWAERNLKNKGYYVLAGTATGDYNNAPQAINWYLKEDFTGVAYFDRPNRDRAKEDNTTFTSNVAIF